MGLTYTETFTQLVSDIVSNVKERKTHEGLRFAYSGLSYDLADRTERMALIQRVTDDYVLAHADVNQLALDTWAERGFKGERPPSLPLDAALIDRLTDAVIDEELTDPNPYKVTHEEYPFMSDYQLELRRDRETGLKAAEETGTDGRDYRRPTKRRRTNYENWRVDSGAKIRNSDRAAQYKRDTTAGAVVSYNLRENGGELTEPFVAAQSVAKTWRAFT